MRISEAYEHEPLLSRQNEDCCHMNGCGRVATQCVDINAQMILTPTAAVGTASVSCQGAPRITCETNDDGTCCVVNVIQQICVSVPVSYGVTMTAGEPTIGCADNCVGCGCC